MSYEPLHHKYRPQTFADLVGQEAIATTLSNAIGQEKIAPAYLFSGPRGTGKTSSARILAKSLNCLSSDVPTATPCGKCDVCQGITKGSTLDVIEIDAASNTGVDNIRELIERAQFAPVQCRHKVYIIDECLTGDSLVLTEQGLIPIDRPEIKGKKVLSYNESTNYWEFKKVLRWLDRGEKQTIIIRTNNQTIKCTGNHLMRTDRGWIPAKNVRQGMKILSPVNVVMANSFTIADFPHKDILKNKIQLSPNVLKKSHIQLEQNPIKIALQEKDTATVCTQTKLGNGLEIANSIQSSQWVTNLETVKSVKVAGIEKVYDIEVEDNHNFIANGLLVHNCHMLSAAAFNALLKTLEEPPEQIVFVLATTDPQRVLPTIISRCQRFDFRRIPLSSMVNHLRHIANQENININDEAITLVAQIAQGGLRDAESTLDQLSLLPDMVTVEKVWDLVGAVPEQDLMSLLSAIANNDAIAVLDIARRLMDRGREPLIVIQNLASFYRDLLIAKTAPNRADLVAVTSSTWENLCRFKDLTIPEILAGQKNLKESEYQLKNTTQPRLWLEVTLIGLLPISIANQPVKQNRLNAGNSSGQTTEINRDRYHPQPVSSPLLNPNHQSQQKDNSHLPAAQLERLETKLQNSPDLTKNTAVPSENGQTNTQQVYANYATSDRESARIESDISSAESDEISTQQLDLDQIWRKVLPYIQPNSIQQLLSQLCRLENFTDGVATISVLTNPSSQKSWVDNLQERLPNIEAAFQSALNLQVKVILVRASSTTAKNNRASQGETRTNAPKFNNSANSRKEALVSPPSTPIPGSSPKVEPEKEVPTYPAEIKRSSPPPETPALDRDGKSKKEEINDIFKHDAEVVSKAAKRLVEIFQGEIIELTEEMKISLFATKEQQPESHNVELNFTDLPEEDLENEDEDF